MPRREGGSLNLHVCIFVRVCPSLSVFCMCVFVCVFSVCVELRAPVQAAIDNSCPDERTALYMCMCVYSFVFVSRCVFCVCVFVCVFSVCVELRAPVQAAIDNSCPDERTALYVHVCIFVRVCLCVCLSVCVFLSVCFLCVLTCELLHRLPSTIRVPTRGRLSICACVYIRSCLSVCVSLCMCVFVCVFSVCVELRAPTQAAIDNSCPDERTALYMCMCVYSFVCVSLSLSVCVFCL